MVPDPHHPEPVQEHPAGPQIELLLADKWHQPLWRHLLGELRDRFAPEKLPPLQLTSRPVDVGMLQSDRVSVPWYRTVFSNLGDVVSPEILPPLELESRPADVDELISDMMGHGWWTSLLRNLADRVAPERLPPLELTAKPMDLGLGSRSMLLARWSSVISTPKVFLADKPKSDPRFSQPLAAPPKPKPDPAEVEVVHVLEADLKRDLRRSIFRQRLWISLAVLEVLVLIGTSIWLK
ncbi:hypothetical protein SBA7_480016 [Candidatus Sulfotelmatobacter sp. SbA7]|jgi:hypothetical protein|nr:hypothetical protein SBA7_480016 [Candidatus Sulfotelmatobacter sp. SbA7]